MSIQQLQEHTGWPISWQTVRRWLVHVEMIFAILITLELASQVVVALILWILKIIFAIRRCLPDIDDCTWDSFSCGHVCDLAMHECWLTVRIWVLNDRSPEISERSSRRPEWTQDGGRCWVDSVFSYHFVGDFVDQSGYELVCNVKVLSKGKKLTTQDR